jgi:uncharacterized protein with PQ loop repeat
VIIVGWLGGIVLALSSLPQAIKTFREGNANGLSGAFIASWLVGEILSLAYVGPTYNWPLIASYGVNLLIVSVIGYYKVWPRDSRKLNTFNKVS